MTAGLQDRQPSLKLRLTEHDCKTILALYAFMPLRRSTAIAVAKADYVYLNIIKKRDKLNYHVIWRIHLTSLRDY
jgi:hypothetical protein